MKSGFCAVVGRPSSGKSTLLNTLCGQKVSIVSSVPQTTRNQIRGILNEPEAGQIVFLDTPGFHLSERKFNLSMMNNVNKSLDGADVVLYLVDATRETGPEEKALQEKLATVHIPVICGLNKKDIPSAKTLEWEVEIRQALPSVKAIHGVSALTKAGLDTLTKSLFAQLAEGEAFYPQDFYTDQEPRFRIAEIVREAAINRVTEELPHALYVEVADLETRDEGKRLWIRAFLTVERDSQIGILVGQGGSKIKEIRVASQKELGKIFSQRIELDLRVKVNAKWRTKDHIIQGLLGSIDSENT